METNLNEEFDFNDAKDSNDINDLINACKIDLDEILLPPPVAITIQSDYKQIALFTKGNFSIVTGKAKSKKTFLISMLMATAIKGSFQDLFACESSGMNILFDTEQSRHKAQMIAQRICRLSGVEKPTNFETFALRTLDPSQRIDLIETVLQSTPNINFVAIDGIIDLDIDPILQSEQAQNIISKLMKWTDIYKIHIVCVLHYNKTVQTLLGHLGSFAHRKADAIIQVTKSSENENISIVEPVDCREIPFQPFAFSVDETGLPYFVNDYTFEKKTANQKEQSKPKPKPVNANDLDETQHKDILNDVFKIHTEQSYNELWRNIKNATEKLLLTITDKFKKDLADNRAKDFITHYLSTECIIKIEVKGKSRYTLSGQTDLSIN